ncbi:S1 family peptidase [Amycolatopsis sp. NPDC059021]|uniref:S1 family peptidase n=1 Tax=Amycolatopsis sp. NPDC059021 TaxID=3346704 RepID=UPI00366BA783
MRAARMRKVRVVSVAAAAVVLVFPVDTAHAIIGGREVPVTGYPFAVMVNSAQGRCGGVLVAPDAVLTAGHCAAAASADGMRVVAGRQHPGDSDGVDVGVRRSWVHPGYENAHQSNDIAVLRLDGQLRYRPAKFAGPGDEGRYAAGTQATVVGWGRVSASGAPATTLNGVTVSVMADQDCAAAYGDYDRRVKLCAGDPHGGKDACQGDSGGPLLVDGVVIGIVSGGAGCGEREHPGIYTRLASFTSDLQDQLKR